MNSANEPLSVRRHLCLCGFECGEDALEAHTQWVRSKINPFKHARYYWLLLAESHLTRRLFGGMLQKIVALLSPAGEAGRGPKQISVPRETGEGKVPEKRVREAQFWALGFSRKRRKGHVFKNLVEALQTEAVTHKVSVVREVKMEIPNNGVFTAIHPLGRD